MIREGFPAERPSVSQFDMLNFFRFFVFSDFSAFAHPLSMLLPIFNIK